MNHGVCAQTDNNVQDGGKVADAMEKLKAAQTILNDDHQKLAKRNNSHQFTLFASGKSQFLEQRFEEYGIYLQGLQEAMDKTDPYCLIDKIKDQAGRRDNRGRLSRSTLHDSLHEFGLEFTQEFPRIEFQGARDSLINRNIASIQNQPQETQEQLPSSSGSVTRSL